MTETAKTVLFTAAAGLSLLVAFALGPATDVQNLDELVGTKLNQFEVDVAKRLKIIKFDKETASTREFEVAESDGLWTIPSKQDYPADAASQMAEAATCLIDREVLRVAGKNASEHEALGVIDPSSSKLDSKAEGVGIRVTITNTNDESLADMIIGKAVKDAEGQHYVRNADQDVVYVVNLDPEKLSTKFEDWIEDDLLMLNPLDIQQVNLEDYSAELQIVMTNRGIEPRIAMDRRGKMTLTYDSSESKWQASSLQKFDQAKEDYVEDKIAEDEEINEDTLRELRNGLDDLLLVDVEKKPEGLSSDLKASSDFLTNREAITSLQERGFIPIGRNADGSAEIASSDGEIICTLKDGVEYVLRFGNLQIDGEGNTETEKETTADDSDQESADGINRYLFVMARFNESMIEQPDLAELPELPENANEEEKPDEEGTKETASTDPNTGESASADAAQEPPAKDSNSEEKDPETEEPTAEDSEDNQDDELAKLTAEREALEKENQRKLDEYQEKLKSGKERVQQLNERFGDWYYVISNEVYKKIHLNRDQVIKKKEAEESADSDDAAETPASGVPGLPNLPIGGAE